MKSNYSIILLNALPDKKIKSLGNKYLIKINKHSNIIDHQIKIICSIFSNPEIIVVGGFDGKRLSKYIQNNIKYKNIKYIEHDLDDRTNIGTSIKCGMATASNQDIWIINSSILLNRDIINLVFNHTRDSFVLTNRCKGDIGFISNNNILLNCYYDLPNTIIDSLFINRKNYMQFKEICSTNIEKLYFFEVLNLCVQANIDLSILDIQSKLINTIDSVNTIEKIKKIYA
jgi:hypothetical protein